MKAATLEPWSPLSYESLKCLELLQPLTPTGPVTSKEDHPCRLCKLDETYQTAHRYRFEKNIAAKTKSGAVLFRFGLKTARIKKRRLQRLVNTALHVYFRVRHSVLLRMVIIPTSSKAHQVRYFSYVPCIV